jgi:Bacterial conjugation TrbI-like protein
MDKRTILISAVLFVVIGTIVLVFWYKPGPRKQMVKRTEELAKDMNGITQPAATMVRNFVPALPLSQQKRPLPAPEIRSRPRPERSVEPKLVSLTVVASGPQPDQAGPEGPQGAYAPAYRLVKCQLVNTVDSSNTATPIIGLVTQDLWWNGQKIIAANSEVHTQAALDTVRERIASTGDITFILNEPDKSGRELVVSGVVLDMDSDEQFDTYGISDGSAGLRGEVIKTLKYEEVKLFAASALSAIAGAAGNIFGNRVYTNNSSLGLSALQNGVVTPATAGTQAVLDRYAELVLRSIERDGFFIRVPAAKQFYVYVTESIDLAKARVANDRTRLERESRSWANQTNREQVRRALPVGQISVGSVLSEHPEINPLLPPPPADLVNTPRVNGPQPSVQPLINNSQNEGEKPPQ